MNYNHPELLEGLAQRYVLGIMGRASRSRFKRLLPNLSEARAAVNRWEELLQPIAWSVQPVTPSELVWQRIARRINSDQAPTSIKEPSTQVSNSWRAIAASLMLATLITSLGWWRSTQAPPQIVVEEIPVPEVAVVAAIGGDANKPVWVTRIFEKSGRIDITIANNPEQQSNNDYQLWLLKADGQPVSMGLLPQQGTRSLPLTADVASELAGSTTLAVSLEPLGGSPQDTPSGPVLFTAALLAP